MMMMVVVRMMMIMMMVIRWRKRGLATKIRRRSDTTHPVHNHVSHCRAATSLLKM